MNSKKPTARSSNDRNASCEKQPEKTHTQSELKKNSFFIDSHEESDTNAWFFGQEYDEMEMNIGLLSNIETNQNQ